MYLLDTNVVSEMRRGAKANRDVRRWDAGVAESDCFISAVTIFELRLGALLKQRRDPRQGALLLRWIDNVCGAFHGRVLSVETADWIRCADLHVPDPKPLRDSLIAACALNHELTVVTRNVHDFDQLGVGVVNPWNK